MNSRLLWALVVLHPLVLTNGVWGQIPPIPEPMDSELPKDVVAAFKLTSDEAVSVNKESRVFRLHFPNGKKPVKPSPVILVLHGWGATARITEKVTGFSALSDKEGFVVAYLQGNSNQWDALSVKSRDVAFVRGIIERLVSDKTADPTRVLVTGISLGAQMTNRVGLELGDKLCAIAPVAATIPTLSFSMVEKSAKQPLAVIYFHGTADVVVKTDGTDAFTEGQKVSLSQDQFRDFYVKRNGCKLPAVTSTIADGAADGTTVDIETYSGGKADVVLYKIKGGGHTWPGGYAQPQKLDKLMLGRTTRNINATNEIWTFFKRQP